MKNMLNRFVIVPFLFVSLTSFNLRQPDFSIHHLRTEYLKNPWGMDVSRPRFSWQMESRERDIWQKAYQVLVASSPDLLNDEKADLWNSHRIDSRKSINIVYKGKPLQSNKTYYWEVRVWNQHNMVNRSKAGKFHTGLLKQSDWHGYWISAGDTTISAPLLRKNFPLNKKVKQATAYVTGVGYYELYLNGSKVSDHVLDPGMTNYRKRTLYAAYDITSQLQKGGNAVGIMLGNGAWRMLNVEKNRYHGQYRSWGPPRAILQLNILFDDGTKEQIVTDTTWKSHEGPITYNSFYGGEDYDARLEQPGWSTSGFNDATWGKVVKVNPPGGILKSQMMPPIKVVETIKPVRCTHPSPGVYIFDLGQNIPGWWRIHVKGKSGTILRIWGAETLNDSLFATPLSPGDQLSTKFNYHSQVYTDYILKGGKEEVYEPRFFYTGFRYIEVSTDQPDGIDSITVDGRVVQTALPRTGEFSCSDSLLNKIHHATVWSFIGNTHSYPSDCPQREKGAYTGDGEVVAEAIMHDFNMTAFYTNWMADMHDVQQKNGYIPNTAPNLVGGMGGGIPWGSAYILIPWWMYEYYGDKRMLEDYYSSMEKYVDYLHYLARHDSVPEEKYIINKFGSYWYSLGEWCAPGENDGPNHPVVSTAYWYNDVVKMADMAQILGKKEDEAHFRSLADTIRQAFNKKFLDPKTNLYGTKTPYQTYQVLALAFGLAPHSHQSGILHALIDDIVKNHQNHLNTGILGTKYLFPVLMHAGYGDLAYKILTQKTYPGYGYWIEHGATTLWEHWGGEDSHNHQMFGSVDEFFYEYLAGIRPPKGNGASFAYQQIFIKPFVPAGLNQAGASLKTIQGKIVSKWKRNGNQLELKVSLPANTSGKISVPMMKLNDVVVTESGKQLWKNGMYVRGIKGITGGIRQKQYITFDVGSGNYTFHVSGK